MTVNAPSPDQATRIFGEFRLREINPECWAVHRGDAKCGTISAQNANAYRVVNTKGRIIVNRMPTLAAAAQVFAMTKKELAPIVAREMVEDDTWRTRVHYSVMTEDRSKPPPFPTEWRSKNMFGAAFNLKERRAAAEEWVATALLAGFVVFHSSRKGGSATGRGLVEP